MNMRSLLLLAGICAGFAAFAAPLELAFENDHTNLLYRCGEKAVFTVRVTEKDGAPARAGVLKARLDNFGPKTVWQGALDLAKTNVFTVSGTLDEPGFLRLTVYAPKQNPVTWSVGYEPTRIRKGSPSPDDFDAYWAEARAKLAREVPIDVVQTRVPERSTNDFDFYQISFATFGRRVSGYLSVPTDKSKGPFPVDVQVAAAGLGNWSMNTQGSPDSIVLFFGVFPFQTDWRWETNGIKAKYNAVNAEAKKKYGTGYAQSGITDGRESYFFYPVILGIDRAVTWVVARDDVDRTRVRYQGTSQGGGFGFYLCGLNRAFTRAAFYVPAITDTMGYLKGRQSGWPSIIEKNVEGNGKRVEAELWAPYFDGANFASRITCPVRVAVGFADTTCAPCAVYAAYNEIRVPDKAIGHGFGMTHSCFRSFYDAFGAWVKQ